MAPIRVLIADDHTLLRAGIRALLETLPDVEVIAEAADGPATLAMVGSLRPDVVLMDITMPPPNGLEAAARIAEEYPSVRVLILSMHKDEGYARRAILAGAAGYLLKDADIEELGLALRAVARGESYLSPAVSAQLVADYRRQAVGDPNPGASLTPRQREVLLLIAQGKTTKAIARTLGISIKTVESHRNLLMDRLGIRDIAGLVRHAIRVGLISPEG